MLLDYLPYIHPKCKIVRKVNTGKKELFLTFDDGPTEGVTNKVLNILERFDAKATFFCVANKALACPGLTREIIGRGHEIGNHSLDHGYIHYFKGKKSHLRWVKDSEDIFEKITGKKTIGFRPPVGIKPPPLQAALKELKIPMILWNKRYFDTQFAWNEEKALAGKGKLASGSIILLHDSHHGEKKDVFLDTLPVFLADLKKEGFIFSSLRKELL